MTPCGGVAGEAAGEHVTVVYVMNGTTHTDEYHCAKARSTASRKQGKSVLNLRFLQGSDEHGPVTWVTYLPDVKATCRPASHHSGEPLTGQDR